MFYVSVNFIRFGFSVDTLKEAEKKFKIACEKYPFDYVAIYNENGQAIKENFKNA